MAFRSKAALAAGVLIGLAAGAQPLEFALRHDHLRKSGAGVLRVDADAMTFSETSKDGHSRTWNYDDVQQLTLERDSMRVLSYEDSKWKGGRDREWVFDGLPDGASAKLLPVLRAKLGGRLVAAIADPGVKELWRIPVKLKDGFGGSEGMLIAGSGTVVYDTKEGDRSRTWRIEDIDNVASAGPYSLTITTAERGGTMRGGSRDFEFQLKRPLTDERYQDLWRRVHRSKGLFILQSGKGEN
jgi:hypothetical protein